MYFFFLNRQNPTLDVVSIWKLFHEEIMYVWALSIILTIFCHFKIHQKVFHTNSLFRTLIKIHACFYPEIILGRVTLKSTILIDNFSVQR